MGSLRVRPLTLLLGLYVIIAVSFWFYPGMVLPSVLTVPGWQIMDRWQIISATIWWPVPDLEQHSTGTLQHYLLYNLEITAEIDDMFRHSTFHFPPHRQISTFEFVHVPAHGHVMIHCSIVQQYCDLGRWSWQWSICLHTTFRIDSFPWAIAMRTS